MRPLSEETPACCGRGLSNRFLQQQRRQACRAASRCQHPPRPEGTPFPTAATERLPATDCAALWRLQGLRPRNGLRRSGYRWQVHAGLGLRQPLGHNISTKAGIMGPGGSGDGIGVPCAHPEHPPRWAANAAMATEPNAVPRTMSECAGRGAHTRRPPQQQPTGAKSQRTQEGRTHPPTQRPTSTHCQPAATHQILAERGSVGPIRHNTAR